MMRQRGRAWESLDKVKEYIEEKTGRKVLELKKSGSGSSLTDNLRVIFGCVSCNKPYGIRFEYIYSFKHKDKPIRTKCYDCTAEWII